MGSCSHKLAELKGPCVVDINMSAAKHWRLENAGARRKAAGQGNPLLHRLPDLLRVGCHSSPDQHPLSFHPSLGTAFDSPDRRKTFGRLAMSHSLAGGFLGAPALSRRSQRLSCSASGQERHDVRARVQRSSEASTSGKASPTLSENSPHRGIQPTRRKAVTQVRWADFLVAEALPALRPTRGCSSAARLNCTPSYL